jgi:photosystem II stability/assembly factor-like uncharacterized protein
VKHLLIILSLFLFSLTIISCSSSSDSGSSTTSTTTDNNTTTDDDTTTTSYSSSGKFVAVGKSGTIITSTSKNLWEVTYGNSNFVTVGNSGTIYTSSDNGITWISKTSGTTETLYEVTYDNSILVTVGGSGTILTSSDGTSRDKWWGIKFMMNLMEKELRKRLVVKGYANKHGKTHMRNIGVTIRLKDMTGYLVG